MRILLVGGGHTHLEVLRRAALRRPRGIDWTLVSQSPRHHYSGMVPGYLAGAYAEEMISFDLISLARRASAEFVKGKAVGLDPNARRVALEDGRPLSYDLVSFGIGSGSRGDDAPGVREYAATVKPIERAAELKLALDALAGKRGPVSARVVGAGAAGVEVACAIAAVLDRSGARRDVSLLDADGEILASSSDRLRSRARAILEGKRIGTRTRAEVRAVRADAIELGGGELLPSDLTVWLTGPAAPALFRGAGLAVDPQGFLLVDDALRSVSDPRVHAVGDCATLASHPETAKAGVYAVRHGPVLWRSLLASATGGPLPRYRPQKDFLSILNTADGKALLRWGPVVAWSRSAFRLKDAIDRRFMRRYAP